MKKLIKNKLKKHSKIIQGLLIGITVSIIASVVYMSGLMENIENFTADWRRVNFSSGKSSNKIVYVKIDQNSLTTIAEQQGITWPWPRQAYAFILKYLKKAGAKATVFDMLFTEFSKAGVEDDKIFAAEITNFGSVYFGVNFQTSKIKKGSSKNSKSLVTENPLGKFALSVKVKGKDYGAYTE